MINWMTEKLKQIEQMGEAVVSGFVPNEIAEQRYNLCLECEEFRGNSCKLCGCYMPAKVLFKKVECPKKHWGTYESETG